MDALQSPPGSPARYALLDALWGSLSEIRDAEHQDLMDRAKVSVWTGHAAEEKMRGASSVQLTPYAIKDDLCVHPFAPFIRLLDAFFCGIVGRLLGFVSVGDNLVTTHQFRKSSAANFYTLERSSEGAEYDGRRLRHAAVQRRLLTIAAFLFAIIVTAWAEWTVTSKRDTSFPTMFVKGYYNAEVPYYYSPCTDAWATDPVRPERSYFRSLAFYIAFLFDSFAHYNAFEALPIWATLCGLVISVAYTATLLQLSSRTRLLQLPKGGGLSAILPSFLLARDSFAMVSYGWDEANPKNVTLARSLAHALPGCWIDVKWLAPGMVVAHETIAAAKSCFCLIFIITPYFLTRPACLLELAAAVHSRESRKQHTLFLCLDSAIADAIEPLLQNNGMQMFRSQISLLRYLSASVYASYSPSDTQRLLLWYKSHSAPLRVINRTLILPSPYTYPPASAGFKRRLSSIAWAMLSFVLPPAPLDALVAGTTYLSSDAHKFGACSAYSSEHLFVALQIICFGALALQAVLTKLRAELADKSRDENFIRNMISTLTTISCSFVALIAVLNTFTVPLSVFFDPRVRHSPELLPLNAAAACNFAQRDLGGTPVFSVGFYLSKEPTTFDSLTNRLKNIMAFLGPNCCGLPVEMIFCSFSSVLARLKSRSDSHIAVIVIRTTEDARLWLHGGGQWPESQTVLIATKEVFDELRQKPDGFAPSQLSDYILVLDLPEDRTPKGCFRRRKSLRGLGAYTGFATNVVDAIGAKVAHSFFAAKDVQTVDPLPSSNPIPTNPLFPPLRQAVRLALP